MQIEIILQSIVLGIIQGLTEFIPVSSSAHVTIIPPILGWESSSTLFVLSVHIGTLISLLFYFRSKLLRYLKSGFNWIVYSGNLDSKEERQDFKIFVYVMLAAIPAGVIGLLLDGYIESFYDDPSNSKLVSLSIIGAMALLGLIFIYSDRLFTQKKISLDRFGIPKSVLVGFSQALAFLRGISRSGATILVGQSLGLSRVDAAELSFLISIPLLLGITIIGLKDLAAANSAEIISSLVGMLSASISGYLAIKFMLNYLRKNNLKAFGWYRLIFAFLALLILFY